MLHSSYFNFSCDTKSVETSRWLLVVSLLLLLHSIYFFFYIDLYERFPFAASVIRFPQFSGTDSNKKQHIQLIQFLLWLLQFIIITTSTYYYYYSDKNFFLLYQLCFSMNCEPIRIILSAVCLCGPHTYINLIHTYTNIHIYKSYKWKKVYRKLHTAHHIKMKYMLIFTIIHTSYMNINLKIDTETRGERWIMENIVCICE